MSYSCKWQPARCTILAITLAFGLFPAFVASAPLRYRLIRTYPHSRHSFTEGLAICNGNLVESDGLYGHSAITIRSLRTHRVLSRRSLPGNVFGEGVTCADGLVIQLTWRRGIAYFYNSRLRLIAIHHYSGEGWGITYGDHRLIVSNGGDELKFFRATDFKPLGEIVVRNGGHPLTRINELEWVRGYVFANIWHSQRIAEIDPIRGTVVGWIDCARLTKLAFDGMPPNPEDVLNGIAYDRQTGNILVTGKRWPTLFELKLVRPGTSTRPLGDRVN